MTATSPQFAWVPAAPFRAHLASLLALTGLPWPVFALAGNVPTRLVRRLVSGQPRRLSKLPAEHARRLLMLTESTLTELASSQIPSGPAQEQLTALIAQGYSIAELARYCHLSTPELEATMHASSCSRLTALLIESVSLHNR